MRNPSVSSMAALPSHMGIALLSLAVRAWVYSPGTGNKNSAAHKYDSNNINEYKSFYMGSYAPMPQHLPYVGR